MSVTGLLRQPSCRCFALLVAFCAVQFGSLPSAAWAQNPGTPWGPAPGVQNPVYSYGQPVYTPQGTKIPGHLWDQAMRQQWQQLAYQSQLGTGAATQLAAADSAETVSAEPAYAVPTGQPGVYGAPPDRYYSGGINPRLITTQRYGDHYLQANVDFIDFRRTNMNAGTKHWVASQPHGRRTGAVRASLRANPFYSCDFEFAYLGGLNWSRNLNTSNTGLWWGNSAYTPPGNGTGGDPRTYFNSHLNSYEFNTRWRWVETARPWTGAWILGVRYVDFEEAASGYVSDISPTTATFEQYLTTSNDLVGFQLGGELFWSVAPTVMIGGDIKAGMYGNYAQRKYREIPTIHTGLDPFARSSIKHGAFVGEANLMVNTALPHGWYIRGGYTCLYLSSVALVADALLPPGPAGLVPTTGSLLVHGFYGGLEWQY